MHEMKERLKKSYLEHLTVSLAKREDKATMLDRYQALALSIRDLMVRKWINTQVGLEEANPKGVCYISLEYLIGRTMGNAMINLEVFEAAKEAMAELGFEIQELREEETDAGLGNGGLGRLAACYLDSMATLSLPAIGYGIRYDYGIFKQIIDESGCQVEDPDNWLRHGNVWEIQRPERTRTVQFHGYTEADRTSSKKYKRRWLDTEKVMAIAYDTPIPGYKVHNVNTLRLWSAHSVYGFNLKNFNTGDYLNANLEALLTENITKVLYPNDNNYEGKELRLKQQYFLVSASIQDSIARFLAQGNKLQNLHTKVSVQLNDTHPSLAIPELMRLLVDVYDMDWDKAWDISTRVFNYTNHTLMSEALEKWPVEMIRKLIPRILEIIFEINDRFMRQVIERYPGDLDRMRRMSLIQEGNEKHVRMAYLAVVGSSHVNGVAALHTELLKNGLFRDFHEFYPEKFVNITNGITPRRWLRKANPGLSALITERIGGAWVKDLDKLGKLKKFAHDEEFQRSFRDIKLANKKHLAHIILEGNGVRVDPSSMFDVQVKRLHEYKRQLLNVLHVISQYLDIKDDPAGKFVPRTVIFAAKAAPGYYMAKLIIQLINSVARVINSDKDIDGKLKVVFLANYRVSLAEKIIPAADLSEQISLAGTEASGTGNMKFALNGALTIGTLDGANIEIHEAVGPENIFIFGMKVEDVEELRAKGYKPQEFIERSPKLKRCLDLISKGFFSSGDGDLFKPIVQSFTYDTYMIAADFNAYLAKQKEVSQIFTNKKLWAEKAILNVANMGRFSSDRSIGEYAEKIWDIKPQSV
ncbi:MAG: glycogen/starch/alpha-glucan phosphorylase [Victivallales bacterium]|nr:glycogen/starch/alpha-glucan phosphorylase [Victivallales bacterium]